MEVNKDAAEQCLDIGAAALRNKNYARAVKMLRKSLGLYPLPGVEALLSQAEAKLNSSEAEETKNDNSTNSGSNNNNTNNGTARSNSGSSQTSSSGANTTSNDNTSTTNNNVGNGGRSYTDAQVKIVKEILDAKKQTSSSVKPHYRVLGIEPDADENAIKKAYRKRALKLHPDKNSAPDADEAFKAVGLAYATLSDPEKRQIYDRWGDEDPDNRGGMGAGGFPGGMRRRHGGQEVSPEDIFNMFFGGMPPGGMGGGMGGMGGPGFRVYTTGNGFQFATNMGGMGGMGGARQQRRGQREGGQQQQASVIQQIIQLLPILLFFFFSFFNSSSPDTYSYSNNYFSLRQEQPYVHPLHTRFSTVKDIPFYVTDRFMRTYARDRYQLIQVERMVEKTYEQYLKAECKNQKAYKATLEHNVNYKKGLTPSEKEKQLKKAREFQLTRCEEWEELFSNTAKQRKY